MAAQEHSSTRRRVLGAAAAPATAASTPAGRPKPNPAPSAPPTIAPALLAKIEIIREHELDTFDDMPVHPLEALRADVARLIAG